MVSVIDYWKHTLSVHSVDMQYTSCFFHHSQTVTVGSVDGLSIRSINTSGIWIKAVEYFRWPRTAFLYMNCVEPSGLRCWLCVFFYSMDAQNLLISLMSSGSCVGQTIVRLPLPPSSMNSERLLRRSVFLSPTWSARRTFITLVILLFLLFLVCRLSSWALPSLAPPSCSPTGTSSTYWRKQRGTGKY